MSTKSDAQALVRDEQQARLLGILARRDGKPVTYAELREAGIEFPAGLVAEMELAGVEIERGQMIVPGGRRVTAVRLRPAPRQLPRPRELPPPRELPRPRELPGRSEEFAPARAGRSWRRRLLVPLALVGDAVVLAAVVLAVFSGGSTPVKRASHRPTHVVASAAQRTHSHKASSPRSTTPPRSLRSTHSSAHASASRATASAVSATTAPAQSATTAPAVSATTATTSQPAAPAPTTPSPPAPSPAARTPVARSLVLAFYEAAAQHRYAAAWALADANMRDELGGYAAFADEMSSVRDIVFHRIETVQSAPDAATFAVHTTSVQSDATQHCSGTVRTVNASGTWLVDGIAIQCT